MAGTFNITLKTCVQDSNVVAGLPTIFGKWFTSVLCLLQGPEIMVKAYRKVGETKSYDGLTLTPFNRLLANPLPSRR